MDGKIDKMDGGKNTWMVCQVWKEFLPRSFFLFNRKHLKRRPFHSESVKPTDENVDTSRFYLPEGCFGADLCQMCEGLLADADPLGLSADLDYLKKKQQQKNIPVSSTQ